MICGSGAAAGTGADGSADVLPPVFLRPRQSAAGWPGLRFIDRWMALFLSFCAAHGAAPLKRRHEGLRLQCGVPYAVKMEASSMAEATRSGETFSGASLSRNSQDGISC